MKIILLFGAGKSATALIKYLLKKAPVMNWKLIVADANKELVCQKLGGHPMSEALALDVKNEEERKLAVEVLITLGYIEYIEGVIQI